MTDARPLCSGHLRSGLRAFAVLGFSLMLAACNGLGGRTAPTPVVVAPPPVVQVQPPPRVDIPAMRDPARFYTPAHMAGDEPIRVALLLPFNSPRDNVRTLSNAIYNAAQLALFEFDNRQILLIPKATGGTSGGAQRAAQEALGAGADLILGPLFAEEVTAVAPLAASARVPVVAFSSDSSVAGNGVYLLSFPLDQDIDRIVEFATLQGLQSFGALYPQGTYGNRARNAFERAVAARAGQMVAATSYPADSEGMYEPARRIAASYGGGNFQALFLPEGGAQLKTISPLLPYYDLDPRQVKFLGTGLWDDPSLALEPPLHGAWFPAPPPEGHAQFLTRYKRAYGSTTPPRIASLGYDAASLAVALATRPAGERFSAEALTDPDGFAGVDGIFRFMPDGRTERGLAVMEIRAGGAVVVDPAPTSFRPPLF